MGDEHNTTNTGNGTMNKAIATVDGQPIEFTLSEMTVREKIRKSRLEVLGLGYDGTIWQGVAPATEHRDEKHGMFYRTLAGEFVAAVIF